MEADDHGKNMTQGLDISGTIGSSPGALSSSFISKSESHRAQPLYWTQAEQWLVSRNCFSSAVLKRLIAYLSISNRG
jgi:hypothetical protein